MTSLNSVSTALCPNAMGKAYVTDFQRRDCNAQHAAVHSVFVDYILAMKKQHLQPGPYTGPW